MSDYLVVGGTYRDDVYWSETAFAFDLSLQASAHEPSPGGPGLCLAVALRRLGNPVTLLTTLGRCADSELALQTLEAEGVTVLAQRHPGALDHAITVIDPDGDSMIVTHRRAPRPAVRRHSADVTVVCSPTRLDRLLTRVSGRMVLMPHSVQCRELSAMAAADRAAVLAATELVIVNEREYELLRHLPELDRVPAVVVTRGERGSTVFTGNRALSVGAAAEADVARNANGAGEAFAAALLTAREHGCAWPEALAAASQYAWRHVSDPRSLAFPRARLSDLTTTAFAFPLEGIS
ncbi:carbohydrate kinase family protein [Nonomuraea sp. SYSU D8015]|uniref:carbohydrate kinase family protein n=1 Tax=Nonomuraea sp. SYSU D8015 TaxID=2593644 RepID=UPI001661115F|nr:PfkB family carbohydrate kinase [Nonomuraea sp. SYSU D8015]